MAEHEHDASCAFGNPTCPAFGEKPEIVDTETVWSKFKRWLARRVHR